MNKPLNITEAEAVFELVKSINTGNGGYLDRRVCTAFNQVSELKKGALNLVIQKIINI